MNQKFETCQILKKGCIQKWRYKPCYSEKSTIFALSLLLRNATFWKEIFTMRQIRNTKIHKEPDVSPERFTMRQNLNWSLYNVSYFEFQKTKTWQKLKENCTQKFTFWIMLPRETDVFAFFVPLGNAWLLKWHFYDAPHFETKYYNVWDFELNILNRVRNWNKVWIKKITLWIKVLRENDGFWIFPAFSESIILEKKICKASYFQLKPSQRFRFWN